MNNIRTNENMIEALKAARIPGSVAENIALVYPVAEIRKIIAEEDRSKLTEIVGVGSKRADAIITALKGKIPQKLSLPCPDVRIPNVEMHDVSELTLCMEDNKAKLKHTSVIRKRYGPALQKLQQLSGEQNVTFTTVSVIDPKDAKDEYLLQKHWNNAVHSGIITRSKKKFVPAIMGTNAKMHCKIHWADETLIEKFHQWTDCGADMSSAQNLAKAAAYRGLLLPFTRELVKNIITPEMECFVPSFNNVKPADAVLFNPDGSMQNVSETTTNEFDGQCYFEMTEKLINQLKLNRHERRQLDRAIAQFNGGTMRAPWQKGLIVVGFHFHDKLRDLGVTHINGKPIDEIAILGDITVFKAAIGETGLYSKFEDYCTAFKANQHRLGVLLENHGLRKGYLPAQQLQAAYGADTTSISQGAEEEVVYINEAKDPCVAMRRYAPKAVAQITEDDPSFASIWFCKQFANQGYEKERTTSLSGRTHNNSVVGFVVKDPVAHMEWIAHLEGKREELPVGFLKANTIYAPEAGFTGTAVASRNPVIAPYGLPLVEVTDDAGDNAKFFEAGFPYITTSIHDNLSKLLRYDQDGDKLRLTNAQWFIDAIRSIQEKYPEYGSFAEWESFGKVEKKAASEQNMLDFFTTCTSTPTLGLNVDMAGKLLGNGLVSDYSDFMLLDYTMNRGTDVKQGSDGTIVPGEAGVLVDKLTAKAQEALYTISQNTGKILKGRVTEKDKVSKEYGKSNCDIIAKAVADGTDDHLEFSGKFDVELVIRNGFRRMPGLVKCGTPEHDYQDEGLFNKLVRRSVKEWAAMDEDQKWKGSLQEWKAWTKQQALKELTEFAEAQGLTLDDVYDTITTTMFLTYGKTFNSAETTEKKRRMLMLFASHYLNWFGDMMVETYCRNKEIDGLRAPQPIECDEIDL